MEKAGRLASSPGVGIPAVADAPDGSEQRRRRRLVLDLVAEPAHMHGDGRLVAERPDPPLLDQLRPGDSSARVNACPGCATKKASRSNSRTVRESSRPPLRARRAATSTSTGPERSGTGGVATSASGGRGGPARRSTAWTRKASSRGLNGLVT